MSNSYVTDYHVLILQAEALTGGESHYLPNLSNVAALLWNTLPEINWCGFYLSGEKMLVLGPFQGKPACIRIPYGKGVCGTGAASDCLQLVPDVHAFPGHIACDSASRSEIVIPIHRKDGSVAGVLDIDSPTEDRFSQDDAEGLSAIVKILEANCIFNFEDIQ